MEHLSKIELIGRVGAVHETIVGNERNLRFSVLVEDVYRGVGGASVHSTWFNCTYWGNCTIEKGQYIHLEGRMVGNTYTDQDGQSRQFYEVKVQKIWYSMTILAFFPVGNELGWERDEFDADIDAFAFKRLWEHREELGARFYDMESHYGDRDTYGLWYNHWLADSDEFENDYNNEDFDGGWWVKSLHVPSDIVKQIISEL